ncbi:aromatic amino acid exporter YddG [Pseudohoeflea coraliihabitans]|uniref:DMT family transporter n=1 Tax=Pseudohoeflea coraliihabitans TaxID=2860393 RepID=A0ABS6WKQ0_9HYPH|nr:DMT family transporter [Pseudohoeflea sp. DP4N28-3]MBW3096531.1 DMT family transporter [Pseudohoeflea sp. DP4N28-3]
MFATLVGFSAVLMWALLALFTAASGQVPPLQLSAMCFAIGGMIGLLAMARQPERFRALRQPAAVWGLGVGGLFGYHFLYFTALRNAPAVEAGLIAYLWPLLIVVGSALLPGERLGWHHVVGALMGLGGTALILTGGSAGGTYGGGSALGYGAALLCAFTWAGYSLLSRRFGAVPSDVVTGFCLATAALSALAHLWLESTVWPASASEWLAVVGLGLGPVGAAFYAWDFGVKHGDIQVLGASSYLAPLLSTLVLIGFGFAAPTFAILTACLLITGGAALAAKSLLTGRRGPDP